jgi:hypothetical protein
MFQINKGDIGFREIKPTFLSLIIFKVTFFLNIYIFMEYFLSEFMYSHTHIYLTRFLFFFSFSLKERKMKVISWQKYEW